MRAIDADELKKKAFGKRGGLIHTEDIDAMPTIEPERKTGKWIPHKSVFGGLGELVYTCDQCGYNIGFHKENFCPNCGARMQEGEDNG